MTTMTRVPAIHSSGVDDEKRDVAKIWGMVLLGSTALMWALTVALATGLIAFNG
jgi:hypothetical protein